MWLLRVHIIINCEWNEIFQFIKIIRDIEGRTHIIYEKISTGPLDWW